MSAHRRIARPTPKPADTSEYSGPARGYQPLADANASNDGSLPTVQDRDAKTAKPPRGFRHGDGPTGNDSDPNGPKCKTSSHVQRY